MNMNVTTNGSVFGSAPAVTQHAWARMCGRRLNGQTIDAVLSYGRVIHVRGAAIYAIGRKEVERAWAVRRGCSGIRRCASRLHPGQLCNLDRLQEQRLSRAQAAQWTALALMACSSHNLNHEG
jgi:hypothetical protein